ncbi:glycosyltransferase family 2 protein [Neptunicella sp.]|uniref:glycosyltransferase family 2 protein n=1 Tax=Neptunicella sp. TaxID=2125986 RepID=UPI003F68E2B0
MLAPSHIKDTKIKLVAIAKDEAAYLPDWIFHHHYFGFDHIDIYINNTSDNSLAILQNVVKTYPVTLLDGNSFFTVKGTAPQAEIYKKALAESNKQGFTHVMFLDIDEFWIPRQFNQSVHECVERINADIICFEWLMRMNEHAWFLPPVTNPIRGHRAQSIKSIVRSGLSSKDINPHNLYIKNAVYKLANGQPVKFTKNEFSKVAPEELSTPVKDYFILHRAYRSQPEYIALLNRGRPLHTQEFQSCFKDNRWGFYKRQTEEVIPIDDEYFAQYDQQRNLFFSHLIDDEELKKARRSVRLNRKHVVKMIAKANLEEADTLARILTNITLPDVTEAYLLFKNRLSQSVD